MSEKNKFNEELIEIEYRPFLPIEKKLRVWCTCWGIILIGLLIWLSYTF